MLLRNQDDLEVSLLLSSEKSAARKDAPRYYGTTSGVLLLLFIVGTSCFLFATTNSNTEKLGMSSQEEKIPSFNLFVFAMTYEPGFCFHKDWDGCVHPNQVETKRLTIHGLWPQFEDGTWPQFCSKEPFDQKIIKEFADELKIKWPDENNSPSDPFASTKLYEHEWSKHGTCSGLSQESYFRAALASYVTPTPSTFIGDHYGSKVDAEQLINAFGGHGIAFPQCKGKYFQGVSFCFDRDENSGQPTTGPTRCSGGTKEDLEKQLCKGMIELEPFLDAPIVLSP